MDKIEVCYSSSGRRFHKVIKYGELIESRCGLIFNVRQRYFYEFTVISYDKNALEDLKLWPCRRCFNRDEINKMASLPES